MRRKLTATGVGRNLEIAGRAAQRITAIVAVHLLVSDSNCSYQSVTGFLHDNGTVFYDTQSSKRVVTTTI